MNIIKNVPLSSLPPLPIFHRRRMGILFLLPLYSIFASSLCLIAAVVSQSMDSATSELAEASNNRNFIADEPVISCAQDAIYVKWRAASTFGGHVTVRQAPNRYCYQVLVTNNLIELLIPHLECRVTRRRVIIPARGLLFEAKVLISFHPEFLTSGDRLYTLRCLHTTNGSEKATPIVVVGGTTAAPASLEGAEEEEEKRTSKDPVCAYEVGIGGEGGGERPGTINERHAPLLGDVDDGRLPIGTPLLHQWSCGNLRANQCLIVTNCALRTEDSEHQLIDEYGCSTVPELVGELHYEGNANISRVIPLFAVADKPFVYFQCQMNLVEIENSDIEAVHSNPNSSKCPTPKCSTSGAAAGTGISRRSVSSQAVDTPTQLRIAGKLLAPPLVFDGVSRQVDIMPVADDDQLSKPRQSEKKREDISATDCEGLTELHNAAEEEEGDDASYLARHELCFSKKRVIVYSVAVLSAISLAGLLSALYFGRRKMRMSRREERKDARGTSQCGQLTNCDNL